jgi:glycosyltransferase involved in cell wall biosynthesis
MRVLYDHQIFTTQKFGGISRYFRELMKIQSESCIVKAINPAWFPKTENQNNQPNIFFRGVKYLKRHAGINDKPRQTYLPEEVMRIFKNAEYDLFHPTNYDPYFLNYVKSPFVLTVFDMIHEIYCDYFPISDNTSRNKRMLCEKAASIITISNNTKNDLISIFNIDKERIHAIQLASDFDKIVSVKPSGINGVDNYILYTGARWLYKNFYFTAISLADILKQDKTLQFLCTGIHFSKEELQFFKDLGIERQVKHIMLENDSELAWVYKNARVFIFPSLYEGFGFPMLEAFACDCPVVASSGGSLPEVGGDGALYFSPRDIRQIQDATNSVLYDSNLSASMIEKGRLQFQKFSWSECRAKTLEVYKSAIKGNE